jgi:mannose-1-phosphate guanylyltransferase
MNNRKKVIPVILAGGSGTRLWPLSRDNYPKQFLRLYNEKSLLQNTVERIKIIFDIDTDIIVVANEDYKFIIKNQLEEIGSIKNVHIINEPSKSAKDTCPAIIAASLVANKLGYDSIFTCPADHYIDNKSNFLLKEILMNKRDSINHTAFGIYPDKISNLYGYIKKGNLINSIDEFKIDSFKEKPDIKTAEEYIKTNKYLWNSGMYLFNNKKLLNDINYMYPNIFGIVNSSLRKDDINLNEYNFTSLFNSCEKISIDVALMENVDSATVFELDKTFKWNDVGSFIELDSIKFGDSENNVLRGCRDTIVINNSNKRIVGIGLEDLIIVDTKDALLVAHKNNISEIKNIINELKLINCQTVYTSREVNRPWGKYETISLGNRHQVKMITVNPGQKLSLQLHHHRAEHWTVVSGTAKIYNGDNKYILTENQSTYIPLGIKHSLENPGLIPLEIIEIQSGPYLGEDDIVRFEDNYGRV